MKTRYVRAAIRDLSRQVEYILECNPSAADALERAVEQVLAGIADQRLDGTEHTLRASGRRVRRWYVPPLMIYYVRRPDEIVVLRVRHHAQRPITR